MFELLSRHSNEETPYRLPLKSSKLSNTPLENEHLSLSNIDLSLLAGALRSYRDCLLALPHPRSGMRKELNPILVQFIERQRRFLLTVIGEQADRTNILQAIKSHSELLSNYDFTKDDEFIRAEAILMSDMEMEIHDIRSVILAAEKNKSFFLEMISTDPSYNVSIRAILSGDPLNWAAFGGTLMSFNMAALALPEPLVTKSVGLASSFIGLAAALVPSS